MLMSALRQARYVDVDVEPHAVNRLCLSRPNVRDYDPPKDYHCVATTTPYVDVEPSAVHRLCLSRPNVRDYDPPKDYHCVATTAPYVDVEPSAVNRLCLSMRDVRDYHRSEDSHVKSIFFTKQSSQCILYGFREGSPLLVLSSVMDGQGCTNVIQPPQRHSLS